MNKRGFVVLQIITLVAAASPRCFSAKGSWPRRRRSAASMAWVSVTPGLPVTMGGIGRDEQGYHLNDDKITVRDGQDEE